VIRKDEGWKDEQTAKVFLKGIRGGIPYALDQMDLMMRLIGANGGVRNFIDLGCGDGVLSLKIFDKYPQAKGLLIDFSETMLQEARARFDGTSFDAEIVPGDFSDKNWVDRVLSVAPFDVVVSGYAIHHQPDERKKTLFREILALLRPGGIFINLEHVSSPSEWVNKVFEGLFADSIREFHRKSGAKEEELEAFLNKPDNDLNILAPADEQCEWLRQAGFADVDCYFKCFETAVFGGRRP
jgi:ubiquinone/menaquinone biosynthesis C-methylase UbiE